jgi:hypothetical protein
MAGPPQSITSRNHTHTHNVAEYRASELTGSKNLRAKPNVALFARPAAID